MVKWIIVIAALMLLVSCTKATSIQNDFSEPVLEISNSSDKQQALFKLVKIANLSGGLIVNSEDYYYILEPNESNIILATEGSGEYKLVEYEGCLDKNTFNEINSIQIKIGEQKLEELLLNNSYYAPKSNVDIGIEYRGNNKEYCDSIAKWIKDNIVYDKEIEEGVRSKQIIQYRKTPEEIVNTKKGICLDNAVLFATLARSEGIPTKVIVGYAKENRENSLSLFHSWNEAYIDGEWQLYDTTFSKYAYNSNDIIYEQRYIY